MEKTTHEKFKDELEIVFDEWNNSLGDKCFGKMGNQTHFYFIRYEGPGNPNSVHSYQSVIKLFKEALTPQIRNK